MFVEGGTPARDVHVRSVRRVVSACLYLAVKVCVEAVPADTAVVEQAAGQERRGDISGVAKALGGIPEHPAIENRRLPMKET